MRQHSGELRNERRTGKVNRNAVDRSTIPKFITCNDRAFSVAPEEAELPTRVIVVLLEAGPGKRRFKQASDARDSGRIAYARVLQLEWKNFELTERQSSTRFNTVGKMEDCNVFNTVA